MASSSQKVASLVEPTFERIDVDDKCGSPGHAEFVQSLSIDKFERFGSGVIHKLFKREAFSDVDVSRVDAMSFINYPMSKGFYEKLRPALRLATIFLERSQAFFMTLALGQIYVHTDKDSKGWLALYPLDPNLLTPSQIEDYEIVLENLSGKIRFCWISVHQIGCCHNIVGQSDSVYLTFIQEVESRIVHRISIPSSTWQAFADPQWNKSSLQQKCYLWFHLAVTLVHELAHVVWLDRNSNELIKSIHDNESDEFPEIDEPIILPSYLQELGDLWEESMFYGRPIGGRKYSSKVGSSCPFESKLFNYNAINGICLALGSHIGEMGITLDSIARTFMEENWAKKHQPLPMYVYPCILRRTANGNLTAMYNLCLHGSKGKVSSSVSKEKRKNSKLATSRAKRVTHHTPPRHMALPLDNHRSFLSYSAYSLGDLTFSHNFGIEDDLTRTTLEAKMRDRLKGTLLALPDAHCFDHPIFDASEYHKNAGEGANITDARAESIDQNDEEHPTESNYDADLESKAVRHLVSDSEGSDFNLDIEMTQDESNSNITDTDTIRSDGGHND